MVPNLKTLSALTAAATCIAAGAMAPAPALADEGVIEEVVVTGTRRVGLSPTETLSPVDSIGGERISRQASFDLTDSLTAINPSLNTQRFPIADGTALIRPVTLRNLSPDHTLVLMNGTRRHRSALVNLQLAPLGTVNQGSQAVDWAAFPAAAIERVEVLRDGASAQYGSDAIAGVINVILKNDSEGANFSAQYGEYYEGDGERLSISGTPGIRSGRSLGSRPFDCGRRCRSPGQAPTGDVGCAERGQKEIAVIREILDQTKTCPERENGDRIVGPEVLINIFAASVQDQFLVHNLRCPKIGQKDDEIPLLSARTLWSFSGLNELESIDRLPDIILKNNEVVDGQVSHETVLGVRDH